MTVIARVFLFFQLITVYPLIAFMLRSQFLMAVTGDVYPGLLRVLGFNTFIVTVCVLFAIFIPSIGTIIRYLVLTSFLVPEICSLVAMVQETIRDLDLFILSNTVWKSWLVLVLSSDIKLQY